MRTCNWRPPAEIAGRPLIRRGCALGLLACLCLAGGAQAQEAPLLDRFAIGAGGYRTTSSTSVSGSLRDAFAGASVHLEDDLGFNEHGLALRVRAEWQLRERQGLSLDYYRFGRTSRVAWDTEREWQGETHRSRGDLDGKLSFAFGSLAWRWWFGTPDNLIGIGLGAGHYRASARLRGPVEVDDEHRLLDTGKSGAAWAPLLQTGWRHAFGEHWRMYFSAAGVFKNGGYLQGHIYNASLGGEWLPSPSLGLALEYGVNSIHIRRTREHFGETLDLELTGPSAFVYLRF